MELKEGKNREAIERKRIGKKEEEEKRI